MPAKLIVKRSRLEEQLLEQIKLTGLPEPMREYRFHYERKWRFDFAWTRDGRGWKARLAFVAVEVEGQGRCGVGRHNFPSGWAKDIEKYNAAAMLGWCVIRVTAKMIRSGEALKLIEEALA